MFCYFCLDGPSATDSEPSESKKSKKESKKHKKSEEEDETLLSYGDVEDELVKVDRKTEMEKSGFDLDSLKVKNKNAGKNSSKIFHKNLQI